ncbi:neuraminidase-like domain-containing protein [Streptomyces coffeae]|uniref:Insecticidal toxin complex protein n=1 Tax=Streptomyces coffeae TaxID=621382 RepID=A0ABS1NEU4_9ACTN|nr:neuraminidase-like domain-containing protein [Streptomyces coffeae]MBL1098614.1 insecticidal toxin complex protein [Streptomyces coffeae]
MRAELAHEYLGITPEEAELLYGTGELPLWELYGFPAESVGDRPWTRIVVRLPEFLARTGLSYCEFLELWRSAYVRFCAYLPSDARDAADVRDVDVVRDDAAVRDEVHDCLPFPDCEPCHLTDYRIRFTDPQDPEQALRRLAVFIRLWRTLRALPGGGYGFAELRDICEVLGLFGAEGTVAPGFLRQLAAFQILRDDFRLALTDGSPPTPGETGERRTHLLALWVGPDASHWDWAVDELLDQVQWHARARHGCGCRPPEFRKLLAENLGPLSRLAGFDPGSAADTWSARPTHTLRFAEILGKIYASDFGIGEILFLFTTDDHLDGDDPFPLQPGNEALDSPLGLPDDETRFSLWDLRRALLAVEVSDEDAAVWSWDRISTTLRGEFGFTPPSGSPDPLLSLGTHFFPSVLETCGVPVPIADRQYRTGLPSADTAPLMWNTPPDGPFRYDRAAEQLWTQLPLTDEAVIAKLGRVRQLKPAEQTAVRELYFLPRADLVPFAFLFGNVAEAEERLLQEPDEGRRWAYFQRSFARAHARCRIIAEHLAGHVAEWTGRPGDNGGDDCGGADLAWTLLVHLYADENRALGPWESDSGERPDVTWPDQPTGGAFAALLGLTGTGLLGELAPEGGPTVWRELRGPMSAFGPAEDAAGVHIPTVLPGLDVTLSEAQKRFVSVRNGLALANPDGRPLGGAHGWTARWSGALLIDEEGGYTFRAGAPAPVGQPPDAAAAHRKRWRVSLRRGQRSWVLLSHDWPDETAPPDCSAPLTLRRGVYQLVIELAQPRPEFARPEDVCPATGGFEVTYAGPDSGGELVTIPYERLFHDRKDGPLDEGLCVRGAARSFLRGRFTSTLRDIRRTYQRAFKALLFTSRFELSAHPAADDGQSELGYLLAHTEDFTGTSYYRHGGGFRVHRAFLDVNFLPLKDNYRPPAPAQDRRVNPSPRRRQALFDWWERIFDYTVVRRDAATAPERPLWLLFHEAAENHPDDPAHLLRHMGVDLLHTPLVLRYFPGHQVSSGDLEDERWAIRVWHADTWIRALRRHFLVKDLRSARPDLWASDDPGALPAGETVTGNQNLTRFVREGCFENGQPRRYEDVKRLNDGLRERARAALHAYLCAMDRVPLPDGESVSEPRQLSEVLLLDVEAGLCERTTRIEEAIGAVQLFIRRAQLGLEPRFTVTPAFSLLWERRFADYRRWETCTRRELYRENWIDWEELEEARRGEGFRLLEAELRGATLTVPLPGGLEHWSGGRPPVHPGLTPLQADRPAGIQGLDPVREGLDLLGTPEWSATPSWLAVVGLSAGGGGGNGNNDNEGGQDGDGPRLTARGECDGAGADIPLWIQAAVRLGTRFIRVAAACEPPAATKFAPRPADGAEICCADCGAPPSAVVDEYYFWTVDVRRHEEQEQQAEWPWHQPGELPRLLHWDSGRAVRLAWCRVHNGRFLQPRRSAEAVRVGDGDGSGDLECVGRTADSLTFRVTGGIAPPPHLGATAGFRYDLPTDAAVPLPLVVEPDADDAPRYPGGLPAYPYFAYHAPGAPLVPASPFAPAVTVAGALRARCRFEAALKWYELAFAPLSSDSDWLYGTGDDARRRSIVLHYTETLLQWGDAALQRGTPEAFGHARLLFDTAARLLGARPRTIRAEAGREPDTVTDFVPLAPPLNPRLLALYDRTADRQGLIRACLDAHRLRRPALPYPGARPDAGRASERPCPDDADWCAPPSPYRFVFLVQKAVELTGEVRALGTALLTAYEKGDAEYLASLRATQESQLLALASQVRQQQWREADWQLQALRKTKEMTQTRRNYYAALVEHGLISKEIEYDNLTGTGLALRTASNVTEGIAQIMGLIPDMFVGFPCNQIQPPVGSKLGGVFSAAARITNGLAEIANTTAGLRLTQAGWERREEEWRHQVEVLDIELEQVERQILAAERRRGIALRELESHQRQLEHSVDVQDFLRTRFTSHDLYLYLQQETAALYDQLYELAGHAARQAQRAFNIERGHTARDFLPVEDGHDLRERLLAGERLQLALRQMEHSYLDENLREYELTKHFSLRRDFPLQFLLLQATGECEFELAEWMFDQDYGHYMRRIRNVGLTIPCVVGPYAGVHCRLTLLSSSTRISPELTAPPAECCGEEGPANGYPALPDDPRVVNEYLATEAIATSTGQNDTGMFELNFRDERKLPFEFRGAVSRWRIEMRPRNNQFDLDTVADVLLHLNYTAREGGDALRHAAEEVADRHLPGSGLRYFDVRHDMTSAWHAFQRPHGEDRHHELTLRLGRGMFPFLPGGPDVRVRRLELFFETADPVPSEHHLLRFTPARPHGHHSDERCPATEVRCVAGADWPGLFHGVLQDPGFGPLVRTGEGELGTFSFPALLPEVTRILLLCAYEVC